MLASPAGVEGAHIAIGSAGRVARLYCVSERLYLCFNGMFSGLQSDRTLNQKANVKAELKQTFFFKLRQYTETKLQKTAIHLFATIDTSPKYLIFAAPVATVPQDACVVQIF